MGKRKKRRKRRSRKAMIDVMPFVRTGVTAGLGAQIVHRTSTQVPGAVSAFSSLTRFQPATGTIVGGSHALKSLKLLSPSKKKRY